LSGIFTVDHARVTALQRNCRRTFLTEPWSVYFGVPAKKIKNRRRNNILELEKEYLAEQLNDSGTDAGGKNY
jgi:hypothetical protein